MVVVGRRVVQPYIGPLDATVPVYHAQHAMSLGTTLADITTRLRKNGYPNEQAISQGIVLRLLRELGWDTYDPTVVWPEYQTGDGRADFALCHPRSKPAIVIEVKQVGRAEGAVRQALQYAFHCGVPFVVLTDGRFWNFYLPAAQGDYEDRRIHRLDLFDRSASETSEAFQRYLAHENVVSGQSLKTAQAEYDTLSKRSQATGAMSEVWRELVEEKDEALIEILLNAVESKVGYHPNPDDAAEFLSTRLVLIPAAPQSGSTIAHTGSSDVAPLSRAKEGVSTVSKTRVDKTISPVSPGIVVPPAGEKRLYISGKEYQFTTANKAMAIVFSELAKRDPSFLERCARHPRAQGRTRRRIGRTPAELYPHDKKFWPAHEKLPGGWVIATHLSNADKRRFIEFAAQVAGLQLDKDIVIPF